jgi:hypothetical protein
MARHVACAETYVPSFPDAHFVIETVIVIRGIGIQMDTCTRWSVSSQFCPVGRVEEVIINEAIHLFTFRYYLAVMIKDQDDLMVLFDAFLPRLVHLKPWRKEFRERLDLNR